MKNSTIAKTITIFIIFSLYLLLPQPVLAQLIITEVFPNPDTSGDATEWLEIYNAGSAEEDLAGWQINSQFLLPASHPKTLVAPGDFVTLTKNISDFVAEYGISQNVFNLPLALTNSGKQLELVSVNDPSKSQLISVFAYGATTTNQAWRRQALGCEDIQQTDQISLFKHTFDESICKPLPQKQPHLAITELMITPHPNASMDKEWIEIQNTSDKAIEISKNLYIKVGDKQAKHRVYGDKQGKIEPENYVIVELDKGSLPDCMQPSTCQVKVEIGLGQTVHDKITYNDSLPGYTLSVGADGNWFKDYQPTPRSKNLPAADTSIIYINEIYPAPQSSEEEWIEIYNSGNQSISLWNWQVTDGIGEYTFHGEYNTTIIRSEEYVQILPQGVTLNNSGDGLVLTDYKNQQIDSVDYDHTSKGEGWGLNQDGEWQLVSQPSPGAKNKFPKPNSTSSNSSTGSSSSATSSDTTSKNSKNSDSTASGSTNISANSLPNIEYNKPSLTYQRWHSTVPNSAVEEIDESIQLNMNPIIVSKLAIATLLAALNLIELRPITLNSWRRFWEWWNK